jgi:DNA polymerase-3 subunit alpha
MCKFCHLHLHTQYSMLDGANKVSAIIKRAAELNQTSIAITDHGNLHGAIEFYNEANKAGIKPIVGCELYVTSGSRHDRIPSSKGGEGVNHLTVLAKNINGYRSLCKLSSLAYQEGFYFKPRIDHELLSKYSDGLIILSGCLASEVADATLSDNNKELECLLEYYLKTFGEDFYLEVQPHPIPNQRKHNAVIAEYAKLKGIPLVATTDCHYTLAEDHYAQEVLMCISTGKTITDPSRLRHDGYKLHLKSAEEMIKEFGDCAWAEEAVKNSVLVADKVDLKFDFSTHFMPRYSHADKELSDQELKDLMQKYAREGLEQRLVLIPAEQHASYRERLELELGVICEIGFAGYFLVVSDFIIWAKENGIPVGPGRGSVAGSLVAWAMRITEVDSVQHKLLFERFLNPERVSLPDIDVDFCIYGRDKVIKYVTDKYGKDKVAQIATFGTLKAKAAIKDVGRALGISFAEMDKIAQLVPAPRQGFDFSITESIKMEPKLRAYAEGEGKDLISLALKLEGLTRHASTHAAGVVIGDRPLTDLLPLMLDKENNDVTQYSMSYVEKIGLVKFDFLGLKTLSVINTALKIIKESHNIDIDLNTLSLEDRKTYQIISSGNTTGVFQLESSGITEMSMRLKPSSFNDLVAILALYRPGPLDAGMVDHYINRKHAREPVKYLHPLMQSALADTYGIMIYQEQIMQLARELAGYSLGQADILRKAMGKKNPEEMAKQRSKFTEGAVTNGLSQKLATEIFDQMETFARYGFNRSHSAAYAMISFQTAWLKAHYGVEFMAALMSHEMGDSDKTLKNMNECRKQGIQILPPDVNESMNGFTVREGKIRYGLEAVKGIGEKAVLNIIESREKKSNFTDLEDFFSKVDFSAMNRRVVESLIKCGAFDSSGVSRAEMFDNVEDLIKLAHSNLKAASSNQISLFGDSSTTLNFARKRVNKPEWAVNRKLAYEREALGFYISGHPIDKFQSDLKRLGAITIVDARKAQKNAEVSVGGVVTALKLKNTKKGDRYANFTFEDSSGTVEALVWPDTYLKVSHLLVADDPVMVRAKVDVSDERCNLIIQELESLIEIRDRKASLGVIKLQDQDVQDDKIEKLSILLNQFKGRVPVKVTMTLDQVDLDIPLRNELGQSLSIEPSEDLNERVEQLFGRPVLSFF